MPADKQPRKAHLVLCLIALALSALACATFRSPDDPAPTPPPGALTLAALTPAATLPSSATHTTTPTLSPSSTRATNVTLTTAASRPPAPPSQPPRRVRRLAPARQSLCRPLLVSNVSFRPPCLSLAPTNNVIIGQYRDRVEAQTSCVYNAVNKVCQINTITSESLAGCPVSQAGVAGWSG